MLELRCLEELAAFLQVIDNHGVSILHEDTGPVCVCRHLALAIHELHKGHIVLAADPVIILTEGRGDVDDAGTVRSGYVIIANYIESLFLQLAYSVIVERLVFTIFQILALVPLKDLPLTFHTIKHGVHQGFSQVIDSAIHLELHIVNLGIHAETQVGGQSPGSSGPGQEVSILVLDLELHHGRTLFHILIALGYLMGGQGCAATGAVRHHLVALVEEALLPDLLQCPPLGLDEVILIGDVGVVHVSPEANYIGELLPHALVLPDRLPALLDERLDAVFLNLLLAVDAPQPALRRTFLPFMDW